MRYEDVTNASRLAGPAVGGRVYYGTAFTGGGMDVLVMLEENGDHSSVLAHVNTMPAPLHSERPPREIVTLYGIPSPEALALALAAAVEGHRDSAGGNTAIRHLGVWPERGALGDAAWRNELGELCTSDLEIPMQRLGHTAGQLLSECGSAIQRLVAGLIQPDWPEGARRAITFSLTPVFTPPRGTFDLETLREADAFAFGEGD
jgi:hypothetical protein